MTYEEAMDRCVIIRDTLLSMDLTIVSNVDNIEWATMCAEAIEKQMPKKPQKTETVYGVDGCGEATNKLVLYTCPVCDEPIHVGRACSNNDCRQAIDWSPEKQILKNAKVLQIPRPRIVEEEGDEE